MATNKPRIETFLLADDGIFPNNAVLPLVLFKKVFNANTTSLAGSIEALFYKNGWGQSWRNGLFNFHHYHSSAHEALGVYAGWVKAQLGGPQGVMVTAHQGDVIIIPAGVAHKNIDQSSDFKVVGAYPKGQTWDMNYGNPQERPVADDRIKRVALPLSDPVFGKTGALMELWR